MRGLQLRVDRIEEKMRSPKSKSDNQLMELIRAARRRCGIPEDSELTAEVIEATKGMDLAQRLRYLRKM